MPPDDASAHPPVKRSFPKSSTRLSQRAQLWLVALLILFVGMEVGFLLAIGAEENSWRGVKDFLEFGMGGEGYIAIVLLGWIYAVLMAKPLLFLARRVKEGVWWVLGILVVTLSILSGSAYPITYSFLLFMTVVALGIPPLWLTVSAIVGGVILSYLFGGPYPIFALPIVAMGFLRYPTGISFKRFLRPSRGVM